MNYSRAELMALVMARALHDGDVVVCGTNATLPGAAYRTAQRLAKPRVAALIGASGTLDPDLDGAPVSGGDQAFIPGRATLDLGTGVMDQLRGFIDVIFLGALQLDVEGRINLAVIGDYARPRLRGPGSIGLSMVGSVPRCFLFFESHDPRVFVPRVDFISGETLRRGAPDALLVVTPLAVFGPASCGRKVALRSVHPGVSFDDVQARTGFPLDAAAACVTPAPSEAELAALRASVDGRRLADYPLG